MSEQLITQPTNVEQPMGPLEEGDQALVDAVSQVDSEQQLYAGDENGSVRLGRGEGEPGEDIAGAVITEKDGAAQSTSARFSKSRIDAELTNYEAGQMAGKTTTVEGNTLTQIDGRPSVADDRTRAQTLKKEAARRIEDANTRFNEQEDTEDTPEDAQEEPADYWTSRDSLIESMGVAKAGLPADQYEELNQRLNKVLAMGDEAVRAAEQRRLLPIDQGGEMGKAGWGDH